MATVLQHQVYPDITSVAGEFMSAGVQSAQGGHYHLQPMEDEKTQESFLNGNNKIQYGQ